MMKNCKTRRYSLHLHDADLETRIDKLYEINSPYYLSMNSFLLDMIERGIKELENESENIKDLLESKTLLNQSIKTDEDVLSIAKYLKVFSKALLGNQNIIQKLLCRVYSKSMNDADNLKYSSTAYTRGSCDRLPKDLQIEKDVLCEELENEDT